MHQAACTLDAAQPCRYKHAASNWQGMTAQNQDIAGAKASSPVVAFLLSPVFTIIVAMFFWGATTIAVRYVRDDAPPMALAFWRNLTAFLILFPFAIRSCIAQWPAIQENFGMLCLLAALLWVGGNALLFLALQYTIAINAAVINSVEPVFIVVVAWLLFRDRFTAVQAFGVFISLAGVLFLISDGSFERLKALQFNIGDVIVTFAYAFWAFYAVLLRKVPRSIDSAAMVLVLIGLGALFLLPLYIYEALFVRAFHPTPMSVGVIVTLAVFSSVIATLLWNRGIRIMGVTRAALFLHLIPVFTVILAIGFLGERLDYHHFIGIALVAAGIFITSRQGSH
jgi:drug/metabolite transporter (DMT)-like permease